MYVYTVSSLNTKFKKFITTNYVPMFTILRNVKGIKPVCAHTSFLKGYAHDVHPCWIVNIELSFIADDGYGLSVCVYNWVNRLWYYATSTQYIHTFNVCVDVAVHGIFFLLHIRQWVYRVLWFQAMYFIY